MGLFDFMKVCLFSEVNGVVTLEGKPVKGAEISRTAEFNDKFYTDKTVTNADGHFHIDAMTTHSINKTLAIVEAVISQELKITYEGKEYIGWRTVKRSYEQNTELGDDKKIQLSCELTDESTKKEKQLRIKVSVLAIQKN